MSRHRIVPRQATRGRVRSAPRPCRPFVRSRRARRHACLAPLSLLLPSCGRPSDRRRLAVRARIGGDAVSSGALVAGRARRARRRRRLCPNRQADPASVPREPALHAPASLVDRTSLRPLRDSLCAAVPAGPVTRPCTEALGWQATSHRPRGRSAPMRAHSARSDRAFRRAKAADKRSDMKPLPATGIKTAAAPRPVVHACPAARGASRRSTRFLSPESV